MTGPPDLDLLADLDAGLLPPERAARVRAAALADPRSAAALDALAATRAELRTLGDPPVPAHLAGRWAAALHDAALPDTAPPDTAPPDTAPPDPDGPRTRHTPSTGGTSVQRTVGRPPGRPAARHRVRRRMLASLAVVVAAASVLLGGLVGRSDGLAVTRVELAAAARSTIGLDDLGELTDPARRDACLAAVGRADAEPVGGRRVVLEGERGVLLVLTTGVRGRFQVLVVDQACGAGDGSVLAELVLGP